MFSKLAIIFVSAATIVSALPGDPAADAATTTVFNKTTNKCNVGQLNCCQSVQSSKSEAVQSLAGILGVALGDLGLQAGLTCNPITVLGVGSGSNCNAQPACCKGNNFNGLVTAGCTPVNVAV